MAFFWPDKNIPNATFPMDSLITDGFQGIFIFDCETEKELTDLLATDPAIKAGRLIFEIYPWYTAPIGSFSPGKPLKN